MKLSMSILSHYLETRYDLSPDIQQDQCTIGGVRFLSDPRLEFSPDYVYVGKMDGFFSDPRYADAIILASGKSRILCRNCEFEELLNDVLSAFDYFGAWETALREACGNGAPLQQLLDLAASQFDATILITDLSSHVLAVSEKAGGTQDAPLQQMIQEGVSRPDVILRKLYTFDGEEYQGLTGSPQLFYAAPPSTSQFIAMYLYADEEPAAVAFVAQPEINQVPLYSQLLNVAAPFLSRAMEFTAPQAKLRSNRSILEDLLEEKPVSDHVLQKLTESSGLEAPYSLLLISHINRYDRPRITATLRGCSDMQTKSIALEFDGTVLLIVHSGETDCLLRELETKLPLHNFRIGVSLSFEEWTGVATANRQARFSIQNASGSGVWHCGKLAFPYLIKTLKEQPMTMELLHPAIEILRSYDEKNQTSLLPTLACFLKNLCSQGKTAQELYIHRNTLTHRLERIISLTNLDFQNSEERDYLCLSLSLNSI